MFNTKQICSVSSTFNHHDVTSSSTDSSYKNRGPNPHLPKASFILVLGPPICASNLSLVPLKCKSRRASLYLLAMDFPWNAPFSFHPAYVACFDRRWLRSIYFPAGCGNPTCWYTTTERQFAVSIKLWVTWVDVFEHQHTVTEIRSD